MYYNNIILHFTRLLARKYSYFNNQIAYDINIEFKILLTMRVIFIDSYMTEIKDRGNPLR
jgi:hypothetical protein